MVLEGPNDTLESNGPFARSRDWNGGSDRDWLRLYLAWSTKPGDGRA